MQPLTVKLLVKIATVFLTVLVVGVIVIGLVSGAGFVKFGIIGDDVYIASESLTEEDLRGRWKLRTYDWGIRLLPGGRAQSINARSLVYTQWALLANGDLVLTYDSVGNGQTISITSVYTVNMRADGKQMNLIDQESGKMDSYERLSDHAAP